MPPNTQRFAIINVHIFDGHAISQQPVTVLIKGDNIEAINDDSTTAPSGGQAQGQENGLVENNAIIDGEGGILLPGLIDCHVHVKKPESARRLTEWGVTTALDMASWPRDLWRSIRQYAAKRNLADLRTAGVPATAPGSRHSQMLPGLPDDALLTGPEQAATFVANRVNHDGADYIKLIADFPIGPSQETLNALVVEAHRHQKLAVVHAAVYPAAVMAVDAKPDVLTHVPMDRALDETVTSRMKSQNMVAVPTLSIEESLSKILTRPGVKLDYAHSRASVAALLAAGVPVFAGTDANDGEIANVRHGESLHHELELLVEAGMTPLDALRAATVEPARYFGLQDRGVIEPGRLADLILIADNPLEDIKATRSIKRVWCRGTEIKRTHISPKEISRSG
ncbi:hypothetical protein VTN96DRAFT_7404 [Rasamsonia emersonii]|uniref:Hydrolase n=1 Tax=Rasamsonia emersonii (strain ATCC 16479 / CBS 393.64 / IMI 116815) TaxID=1408163 RepID=A0A0F4YF79_RASE3|nr:hydrolase [Rasamsonia emersonii CBS 393.64]KKA16892.1 hydrolase [Rasamsonia emersonii CBS 393.64]